MMSSFKLLSCCPSFFFTIRRLTLKSNQGGKFPEGWGEFVFFRVHMFQQHDHSTGAEARSASLLSVHPTVWNILPLNKALRFFTHCTYTLSTPHTFNKDINVVI